MKCQLLTSIAANLNKTLSSFSEPVSKYLKFIIDLEHLYTVILILYKYIQSGTKRTHVFEMGSTSERCVKMLCNFLRPQLRSLRVNMEEMWFQQGESHSPHGKGFDDSFLTNVSATRSLAFWRCPLAPTLTRFICLRFLSLGLPQIKSLHSKTSYSRRSESFHSRKKLQLCHKKC